MLYLKEKVQAYISWFRDDLRRLGIAVGGATFMTVFVFLFLAVSAPSNFPVGRVVTIPEGATLSEISHILDERSIVASPFFLKIFVALASSDTEVLAGDYYFDKPLSVGEVARRITHGDYGLEPVKITVPEGSTVLDIAALFAEKFTMFDASHFLELAEQDEGYLFPDTYLFLPNVREEQVIKQMRETFDLRAATLANEIASSSRSFEDIVIMASIIEKEAWKQRDRRLISGVLWNRIDISMPLQVDATFLYINGKSTYDLTYDDLAIDSPYNTYKYRGLPPGPICNPSLDSIEAALVPEESPYLFYLADRSGNTYYSLDYEEHKYYKSIYVD
jgi:UPF0755 protein